MLKNQANINEQCAISNDKMLLMWQFILEELKKETIKPLFETWIMGMVPIEMTDKEFIIGTPKQFVKEWMEVRYDNIIKNIIKNHTGQNFEIIYVNLEIDKPIATSHNLMRPLTLVEKLLPTLQQLTKENQQKVVDFAVSLKSEKGCLTELPRSGLDNKYTFDSYVVNSDNQIAYQQALEFAKHSNSGSQLIYFYGDAGLGKTHLVQAIGNYLLSNTNSTIKYFDIPKFTGELINAIMRGDMLSFRENILKYDVVIFDNLELLNRKEHTQEEFYQCVKQMLQHNRRVIVTASSHPKEIMINNNPLYSLFEIKAICKLAAPDLDTKIEIAKRKLIHAQIEISEEVIRSLAQRNHLNILELLNDINKVISYITLAGPIEEKDLCAILDD